MVGGCWWKRVLVKVVGVVLVVVVIGGLKEKKCVRVRE
jgi:hypothetical protein